MEILIILELILSAIIVVASIGLIFYFAVIEKWSWLKQLIIFFVVGIFTAVIIIIVTIPTAKQLTMLIVGEGV